LSSGKRLGSLDFNEVTRYTLGKVLMNIEYTVKNSIVFAQAYGSGTYGTQTYSCQEANTCTTTTAPTEGAPNTGFLGLSQDAAIASLAGAVLVAVAIIGSIFVVISRHRATKKKHQE